MNENMNPHTADAPHDPAEVAAAILADDAMPRKADKIRALHAQCPGLTQAEICRLLGVKSGTVSKALKGERSVQPAPEPEPVPEPTPAPRRGRPVGTGTSDKTTRMTILMSDDTAKRLRMWCGLHGMTAADAVAAAVDSYCRMNTEDLRGMLDK